MRYYYYGNPQQGAVSALSTPEGPEVIGDLVIEEDTVYEIDRECIECRDKKFNQGNTRGRSRW